MSNRHVISEDFYSISSSSYEYFIDNRVSHLYFVISISFETFYVWGVKIKTGRNSIRAKINLSEQISNEQYIRYIQCMRKSFLFNFSFLSSQKILCDWTDTDNDFKFKSNDSFVSHKKMKMHIIETRFSCHRSSPLFTWNTTKIFKFIRWHESFHRFVTHWRRLEHG